MTVRARPRRTDRASAGAYVAWTEFRMMGMRSRTWILYWWWKLRGRLIR